MTHTQPMVPVGANQIIGPDRFGPSLWQGLHYITLGYPVNPTEEQKQKYKAFFILLKDTLPCSICANHYAENLKKFPITDEILQTKENLVKWLIDIHNVVNKMKGKEVIDYKVARKMINTDIHCQPTIINKNKDPKLNIKTKKIKIQNQYNDVCDINFIYSLVGILFILILIALVYKKK